MVWHAVRRIFGFALMIREGIAVDEVEAYLHARAWLTTRHASWTRLPRRSPPS